MKSATDAIDFMMFILSAGIVIVLVVDKLAYVG